MLDLLRSRQVTPTLLFLAVLSVTILLHFFLPLWQLFSFPVTLGGIAILLLGVGINLRATDLLLQNRTSLDPTKPPTKLITTGPFRFSRNPIYLGAILQLLGAALFLGSLSVLLMPPLWFIILDRVYVRPEEVQLAEIFGGAYTDYQQRVRRWL